MQYRSVYFRKYPCMSLVSFYVLYYPYIMQASTGQNSLLQNQAYSRNWKICNIFAEFYFTFWIFECTFTSTLQQKLDSKFWNNRFFFSMRLETLRQMYFYFLDTTSIQLFHENLINVLVFFFTKYVYKFAYLRRLLTKKHIY